MNGAVEFRFALSVTVDKLVHLVREEGKPLDLVAIEAVVIQHHEQRS